jgi:molybdate transport system regulatory protein
MAKRSPRPHTVGAVRPRLKLWLEIDGAYVFGRGIRDILWAVEQTGAIKAAARHVGKSYRYVWARIKEAEATLGAPLVVTHVGGTGTKRSQLTELARELVADFDALRDKLLRVLEREFRGRVEPTLKRHSAQDS